MAHSRPRFICDSMLGRLAKKLRMLGFDAQLVTDADLQTIVHMAETHKRIVLTRRSAFRKQEPSGGVSQVFILSNDPEKQLKQVMATCNLKKTDFAPFSICLRCNQRLTAIARQDAAGQVPEYVLSTVSDFSACPQCKRIYWKGTHYSKMAEGLEKKDGASKSRL